MNLTEKELRERLKSKDRDDLAGLERQLRTPLGEIPFLEAGKPASVKLQGEPSGFPQWGELLRELASGRALEAEVLKGLRECRVGC